MTIFMMAMTTIGDLAAVGVRCREDSCRSTMITFAFLLARCVWSMLRYSLEVQF